MILFLLLKNDVLFSAIYVKKQASKLGNFSGIQWVMPCLV